jgi:methylglutaconyl-CoA hydratase
MSEPLRIETDGRGVATVTMDRPEVRNAFNPELIQRLHEAGRALAADRGVRVVVLTGAGEVFSAGADLNWMRAAREATAPENVAGARQMDAMLRALYELPKPLIARINGHALAGGSGLTAVCDIAIAVEGARFGFTEVALGLVPAVISPYVVRSIGPSAARALFVTGEHFGAARALQIGLVHEVVAPDGFDAAVEAAVGRCLAAGPKAIAVAKTLPDLAMLPFHEARERMPHIIAEVRATDEAQEGMGAFLERRRPAWAPPRGPA